VLFQLKRAGFSLAIRSLIAITDLIVEEMEVGVQDGLLLNQKKPAGKEENTHSPITYFTLLRNHRNFRWWIASYLVTHTGAYVTDLIMNPASSQLATGTDGLHMLHL